jgi:hypothetical protein
MIVLRPLWAWLVTGALGIVTALAFFRDEFLPPGVAAQMHIQNLVPSVSGALKPSFRRR